jgi:hypothetical protein
VRSFSVMLKEDATVMEKEFSFRERKWTAPFFVAWILFSVSMFLPAYREMEGWGCAWFVFRGLVYFKWDRWEYYYQAAFNLANLGMLISPLFIRFVPPGTRWGRWILVMMSLFTLHVISWSVMGKESSYIEYGYYLWAASFVVFTGEWLRQTFLRQLAGGMPVT